MGEDEGLSVRDRRVVRHSDHGPRGDWLRRLVGDPQDGR